MLPQDLQPVFQATNPASVNPIQMRSSGYNLLSCCIELSATLEALQSNPAKRQYCAVSGQYRVCVVCRIHSNRILLQNHPRRSRILQAIDRCIPYCVQYGLSPNS